VNGKEIYLIDKNMFAVQDESVLSENEKLSNLLKSWINNDSSKIKFLVTAGCFGDDDSHYKLRKAIKNTQYSEDKTYIKALSKDIKLLENTTKYIQEFAENISVNSTELDTVIAYYNNLTSLDVQRESNFHYPILSFEKEKLDFKS